jgi:hypothetical protein
VNQANGQRTVNAACRSPSNKYSGSPAETIESNDDSALQTGERISDRGGGGRVELSGEDWP